MRQSLTSVLVGLGFAIFVAAAIVAAAGPAVTGAVGIERLGAVLLAIAKFAFLPASAVVVLAESRRVRGLPFCLAAGFVIALAGTAWLYVRPSSVGEGGAGLLSLLALPVAGLAAGWFYWWWTGYRSGMVATALREAGERPLGPALSASRCKVCTAVSLLLGLIPLALTGATLIYRPPVDLRDRLAARAQEDARLRLDNAGLGYLTVTFNDTVGRVIGTAPQGVSADLAFKGAETALAPLVGLPGVVARLDNAIDEAGATAPKP